MMVSHDSVTQWLDRPFFSQRAENACCPASRSKLCPGIRWWYLVFVSSPMVYIRHRPRNLMGWRAGKEERWRGAVLHIVNEYQDSYLQTHNVTNSQATLGIWGIVFIAEMHLCGALETLNLSSQLL